MIVDFHLHVSRPEHEHPWILEFMQTQYEGDLVQLAERVLTPSGLRAFLQENGASHDIVKHLEFPELRATLPRHRELAKGYVEFAVKLVDKLLELKQGRE